MTRIKICGIRRPEDVEYVNEAMPDYCGFITEFANSRRSIDRDKLRELALKLDKRIIPVGVFVNAPISLPARLLNDGVIKIAQLHGSEDEQYIEELRRLTNGSAGSIMKAFSVKSAEDIEAARRSSADHILLDQGSGGTGKTFDWSLASDVGRPFFLAGGLDPGNITEAIDRLSPWAVDLSSSLETDGVKDREKIIEAVNTVRYHDRRK